MSIWKRTTGAHKALFLALGLIGASVLVVLGYGARSASAQVNPSTLYVPLIGISSVPEPLALPKGPGDVTYHYAVKNFLQEYPLADVQVVDDKCSPAKYTEGDDNSDGKLDHDETWRYTCTTKLVQTTQSIATAIGTANNLPAAHKAYATVVVGSDMAAPLVNIINITKVAYPLTLPIGGGDITFTYRVNNPGIVPLSDVIVTDDKCKTVSNKLGDTNGNNLLDINEVWTYTCTTHLTRTTTNTVSVAASANGLKAVGYATITVTVATPSSGLTSQDTPDFPETGVFHEVKNIVWTILTGVLATLLTLFLLIKKLSPKKTQKKNSRLARLVLIAVLSGALFGTIVHTVLLPRLDLADTVSGKLAVDSERFGWEFPVAKFPTLGSNEIAYSDIRDPGGIPQGLPVRLKVPSIGVDSAIEDALITPEGRMDVPVGSVNVAWFALGPYPGQVGSAVIGGHFGINRGVPFVFYDLDKLLPGDKIYVENDKGETLGFVVRTIKLFDRNADATPVFTSQDGIAHLNLITCEGIWNQVNGAYPDRRVVFADALPAGEIVEVAAPIQRPLRLGSRGTDVSTLQTALVEKGFLKMPRNVAKGYYGTLTRSAVARYQKSVGIASNGIFSASTRVKLYPDSKLPSTGIATATSTPSAAGESTPLRRVRTWLASVGAYFQPLVAMYASPIEGLLTSFLLFSITYLFLKITKRLS